MSTPTVTITDSLLGTANRASGNVAYSLQFSESVSGLAVDDFTVSNGSISSITGSGTIWTVNVTPALGVVGGTIGLTLKAGAVSDALGNPNALASNSSQAIDTAAPVAPKLVTSTAFKYLADPQITMQTSLGTVVLELHPEQAPITVANMLAYIDGEFYDNTLFHRVIDGFMVQGGGLTAGMVAKTPTYGAITLESNNGLSNVRGSIAMARTNLADSATTQFFINQVDNPFLNYSSSASPGYAVFGSVLSGLSVIDSIAQVTTNASDAPIANVTISSIRQTVAGSSITNADTMQVSGLEAGAQWSYSLDGGGTWNAGSGSSFALPLGDYAATQIQVRQTDAAGNASTSTGKLTSALAITDIDVTAPTVTLTDNLPGTANRSTGNVAYTLQFSEPVSGLAADDFSVTNGALGSISGSGTTWTVNVSPALGVASGTIGLTLKAGAVSDALGNLNAYVANASQAIDTVAPVAPKLVTSSAFNYLVNPQVTLQTSLGTVVLELNPEQAPITVANMLAYVDGGFYDNTLFHRVINGFMVQGGGFTAGLAYKTPTYGAITLESNNGLSNVRGSIAMARTSVADSATTQFFINQVDNTYLNYSSAASPGYAVFGSVVSGLAVIDSIAQVATTTVGSYTNVPVMDVVITSLRQSVAGSSFTHVGTLQVSGLEAGAQWSYSLDGGSTWSMGSGSSLALPVGSYAANQIQVRQTDAAGNTSASSGKLTSAVVVDTTAPTVSAFSPADGAVGVALGSNIVITFSETIMRGVGNLVLKTAAGAIVESFDAAASSRLTFSGASLTIDPSLNLIYSPGYTVELAPGTVKDLAGNSYAGTASYHFATNSPTSGGVVISGSAILGQTLTADTASLADADGLGLLTYQWQADGSPIVGATANKLELGQAEAGRTLTVSISYSDGHGIAETVHSDAIRLGTAGADTLTCDAARDSLAGGAGDDTYIVSARSNRITELADEGIDSVHAPVSWSLGTNLENLTLTGSGKFSGRGNRQDNILTGNDAANMLDGGAGADSLIGGAGNDIYIVDNLSDVIQEQSNAAETDSVRAWRDWTLGDNLENLTLLGVKPLHGSGNALDNRLTGNGSANSLDGGAGNDVLAGASGNDTLTGGAGSDTFAFTTPLNAIRNVDTITDFSSGTDKLQLSPAIFRELGFSGAPSTDAFFHAGSAAHDADDRIVYDQANGALYYDADGNGALAAVQFAVLSSMPGVQYTDFWVS